jgi:hypothetical protein
MVGLGVLGARTVLVMVGRVIPMDMLRPELMLAERPTVAALADVLIASEPAAAMARVLIANPTPIIKIRLDICFS